ncbi:MAG TPA: VCBS repeat-containing protein, partial [bacterium]
PASPSADAAPASPAAPTPAPSPVPARAGEGEYAVRDLPGGGRALAAGDILGEGRVEIVVSDGDRLSLYRWDEQQLSWRWDEAARGGRRIVGLDAADVDGDGRAEVLVSAVTWGRAATEIRSWRGGRLEVIGTADGLYLRSVPRPGAAPLLLGQRAGIDEVLAGRVEEYRWRDGSVERVDGTALPRQAGIFGLALAAAGSPAACYVLDRNGYLFAFDAEGKALWRSARTYGGYPPPLREQDLGGGWSLEGQAFDEAMQAFQGRLLAEATPAGTRLIVPRNYSDSMIVLTRMRGIGKGEVVVLEAQPGSFSLEEEGRSRSFDGYVADLARGDVDRDGTVETLFLVNRNAGVLLGERARLVAWRPPGRFAEGK